MTAVEIFERYNNWLDWSCVRGRLDVPGDGHRTEWRGSKRACTKAARGLPARACDLLSAFYTSHILLEA